MADEPIYGPCFDGDCGDIDPSQWINNSNELDIDNALASNNYCLIIQSSDMWGTTSISGSMHTADCHVPTHEEILEWWKHTTGQSSPFYTKRYLVSSQILVADMNLWFANGDIGYSNKCMTNEYQMAIPYVYSHDTDGEGNWINCWWNDVQGGVFGQTGIYKKIYNPVTCPPGTHFTNGTCCPDGYTWNWRTGTCEPDDGVCFECYYPVVPESLCDGGMYRIDVKYYNHGDCGNMVIAGRPIHISYAGSTIPIYGPSEIMVDISKEDNHFYIHVPSNTCENDKLNIELIWASGINLFHDPNCNNKISISLCGECDEHNGDPETGEPDHGTPEAPPGLPWEQKPGIPKNTDCCEFFNNTYTKWQKTDNFYCEDFFKDYPMRY